MPSGLGIVTAKLGIIAGRGPIPRDLIAGCRAEGRPLFVIAINGETDPDVVDGISHAWHDVAAVGGILARLKREKCEEIVLIGPIAQPDFSHLKPDWRGIKLLPKLIAAARRGGDDALLSVVVAEIERDGFRIVAAEEVMASLTVPPGFHSARRPDETELADIARGRAVLAALGAHDVGQAAVVRGGRVLAIEAVEGTDAMLARCRELAGGRPAGVLIKAPKAGQERRVDLPTIGPDTIDNLAAAGLAGIAVEAAGTLIIDRDEVTRRADAAGIFVHAFDATGE